MPNSAWLGIAVSSDVFPSLRHDQRTASRASDPTWRIRSRDPRTSPHRCAKNGHRDATRPSPGKALFESLGDGHREHDQLRPREELDEFGKRAQQPLGGYGERPPLRLAFA
jgi:hypothetical protein